jgi:thiol reductant ABC exporter CydC subunit
MSTTRTALRRPLAATRPRRPRLAAAVLLGAGTVLAGVGLLAVSGYLISRAAERPEILSLGVAIAAVRTLAIARAGLRYGERLVSHDLALRTLGDLRRSFFGRLVPLIPGGLPGIARADLLSRFVADVDRLQDLYLRALAPVAVAVVAGGASAFIAFFLQPEAAAVLAAGLLAGALLVPFVSRATARRAGRRQARARAALTAEVIQIAGGADEIALASREQEWMDRCRRAGLDLLRIQRRDALAGGLGTGLMTAISGLTVVAVALVAIPAVDRDELAGVLLAAVLLLALAAFEAVRPLAAAAASIDACVAAASRLDEVVDQPVAVADPAEPHELPGAGALELRDVRFRYGGDGPWLLAGANLRLPAGRAVALLGPSGSGKSTLAELLVRFRDPAGGAVLLGGVDLRQLRQDDVRSAVCLGSQDAHLFSGTLEENLAIARPGATRAERERALERVGLGGWLRALPDGLATPVGEFGAKVSGGQRRRIATARLLLSGARFLIADEPAAHLDPAAAGELLAELAAEARAGRGVLVVVHGRQGLQSFDEVVSLGDGRLHDTRGLLSTDR